MFACCTAFAASTKYQTNISITFQTKLTRLSVWFFMPKPVDKTKTLFSLPNSINQIQTMLMRFIRNSLLTEPRHC